MNAVEQMQGQIAALAGRMERVENLLRSRAASSADEKEAQRVAEKLGFDVEILLLPKQTQARRRLARELRAKGWSAARIARAFNCCERTAERLIE